MKRETERGEIIMRGVRSLVLVSALNLVSCATIIKGSHDTVSVNSLSKDVTIYIDNMPRGKDFVQAELTRGEDHIIRASKKGCTDVVVPVKDSFDAVSLLGVLFDFGIFTIPTDLISGSAWKISPKTYTAEPIC